MLNSCYMTYYIYLYNYIRSRSNHLLIYFQTCDQCKGDIESSELAVYAPKLGVDMCWHPACFVCSQCEELLVDLVYCCHTKKLFCERHYAEQIRPRCPSCDEVRVVCPLGQNYVLFRTTVSILSITMSI